MKYLITGGSGFIGSHLVDLLVSQGHQVRVLEDFSTGKPGNLAHFLDDSRVQVVNGSVTSYSEVSEAAVGLDGIFHLAAAVGVFNIVRAPRKSIMTNIQGTETVLEVALKNRVPILITSSSEIYGKNTENQLREDADRVIGAPQKLRWSYSDSKAIDEALAISMSQEFGLETKIVRLFNTIGPRQLGEYGMVVPRFVRAALKNENIEIYGDGTQSRCFAHVSDVVRAIKLVFDNSNCVGKPINIGVSREISIFNLANKVIALTQSSSQIVFRDPAEVYASGYEDMARRVPSTELLEKLTGWRPERTLDDAIADIAEFMRKEKA